MHKVGKMDRVEEIMDVRCGADLRFCRHFIFLSSILGGGGRKGLAVYFSTTVTRVGGL